MPLDAGWRGCRRVGNALPGTASVAHLGWRGPCYPPPIPPRRPEDRGPRRPPLDHAPGHGRLLRRGGAARRSRASGPSGGGRRPARRARGGGHLLLRGAALRRALGDADQRGLPPLPGRRSTCARGWPTTTPSPARSARSWTPSPRWWSPSPSTRPSSTCPGWRGCSARPRPSAGGSRTAVRAAVGLTASVGIGPNRLVAKIASDFGKPDGLVVVRPEEVLDFLGPQPVGVLRGRRRPDPADPGAARAAHRGGPAPPVGGRAAAPLGAPRGRQPLPAGPRHRLRPGRRRRARASPCPRRPPSART